MVKRDFKITSLLMIGLFILMALGGCSKSVSTSGPDGEPGGPPPAEETAAPGDTEPQYFFINGSLLGSYDDEGWHSLCDTGTKDAEPFFAKDLLNKDAYYVYENDKQVGVAKKLVWLTEEAFGLGSFEEEDAPQKFAEYGEIYSFEGDSAAIYRIFDLPVKLGDALAELKIPNYSFTTDFIYGEAWERFTENQRLVSNRNTIKFPDQLAGNVEPTAEALHLLRDLFKTNHMENTGPHFTECYKSDFDNDGQEEYMMLAENPVSESGYPLLGGNGSTDNLGVFNVIFYQDHDDRIQTLHSDLRPYQGSFEADQNNTMELFGVPEFSMGVNFITAADLNADGVYELTVHKFGWEYGYYLVYALDPSGKYEIVMRSNFGN